MTLLRDERARYERQLALPGVGVEGQLKLREASVLVVGAGGLGSPATMYLAAAGVGRIGVVDHDRVDRSNLHRQLLFNEADVGRPKARAAVERLAEMNPHVVCEAYETAFTSSNAHALLESYDILVDATDNFPARYLANDVAALQGKPDVYASVYRFDGQAAVFDARRGPCYRCLLPRPPPPELVPSCAEGGVLGVLPGLLGSIQAAETIKLILGVGKPLVGKLLLVDALTMESTTLRVPKDPACPLCGPKATIKELVDYEAFCGTNTRTEREHANDDVAPSELDALLRSSSPPMLVDVREPWEAAVSALPGHHLLPLGELASRAHEIPRDRDVVLYCRSGARSGRAVDQLRAMGYTRVRNLAGGIVAWADEVDPTLPRS